MARTRLKMGLKAVLDQEVRHRDRGSVLERMLPWLARASLGLAASLASYLLWHAVTKSAPGGCGPDSACDRVLGSAWAYWLGVPVSAPALLSYLALLGASARARGGTTPGVEARIAFAAVGLSVAIIGAALWFTGLQLFVLKSVCAFCLSTHFFGTLGAVSSLCLVTRALRAGAPLRPPGSINGAVNQRRAGSGDPAYNPVGRVPSRGGICDAMYVSWFPASRVVAASVVGLSAVAVLIAGQEFFPKKMFMVRVHHGEFQLDLREVPLLGPASAARVIVALFDYTCPDCHDTHRHLMAAQARFTKRFSIVALPCPLASKCNRLVRETQKKHQQACEYARLGLAVQRADRAAFEKFDTWFFGQSSIPGLEQAQQFARELVGGQNLDAALKDPWVDGMIKTSVALYQANQERTGSLRLPQLIIGETISVGPINRVQDLFDMLQAYLGPEKRP